MKRQLSACLALATTTLVSGAALADPETHDGFFLRMGLNLGYATASGSVDAPIAFEETLSGVTSGFDLLIGGTPVSGLAIGGALITTASPDPKYEAGAISGTADGTMIYAGVALFGNYYFDPAAGGHLQLLLGYGALDFVRSSGASGGNDPAGPLFGIGGGYEFWVGDQWSIGPFGRLLYGIPSVESGGATVSYTYMAPTVGASFTLH